jgi:hypothetical protein
MENKDFEEYLRAKDDSLGYVRLPSKRHVLFSGSHEQADLWLSETAVQKNMQTNEGAFDGWILVLMAWGCLDRVTVGWDLPTDVGNEHYQRWHCHVNRPWQRWWDRARVAG